MSYRPSISTGLKTTTGVRVDPAVIIGSQVLQMNLAELDQAIDTELTENPALSRIEDEDNSPSREEILKAMAPYELAPGGGCRELDRCLPNDAAAEPDWVDLASSSDSLHDHLRAQLFPLLAPSAVGLGEYLIGSVNDKGYLVCEPEEAALACGCSIEEVEWAVRKLQACEPAGVGATDLRSCLLLQLRSAETKEELLAKRIVRSDWSLLVQKDVRALARKYKCDKECVESALQEVTSLNPFPGEAYNAHPYVRVPQTVVVPDLVVARDEAGWVVEVPGSVRSNLKLDREYQRRFAEVALKRASQCPERGHIVDAVDRANRFLEAISMRKRMLKQIGYYLVENQNGFVLTGEYQFLKPLTRTKMAKELGAHESTVSRATSGKFVQIATGEIVSFDVFFKPALRVQKLIAEILSTENPDNPLSDEAISKMLERQGIQIARRTVNKYRDRTRLLSSRRRKSA